jgi:hypothetical protein
MYYIQFAYSTIYIYTNIHIFLEVIDILEFTMMEHTLKVTNYE